MRNSAFAAIHEEIWPYQKYDDTGARDIATLPPGLQSLKASMIVNECMDAATVTSGLIIFFGVEARSPTEPSTA